MNQSNQSANHSSLFSSVFHKVTAHKRTSITTASAFLFAGAAVGVANMSATNPEPALSQQSLHAAATSDSNQATSNHDATSSSDQPSSTTTSSGDVHNNASVHVSVNGQDITVPANGTTQQTITNVDGTQQTTVTTSGVASNANATSVNVSVNSSSSSSSVSSVSGSDSNGMMNGTPVR